MGHIGTRHHLRIFSTLAIVVVLLAAGCNRSETPSAPQRPGFGGGFPTPQQNTPASGFSPGGGTAQGDFGSGSDPGSGSGSGSADGGSGSGGQNASPVEQQTFAYATVDIATLTADTAAISATGSQLATDASSLNASAAQDDAKTLKKQATALLNDASSAKDRMQPLTPSDSTLEDARGSALDVYRLAESYARAALDTADALSDANLQSLKKAVAEINDLAGTSEQLASAYSATTEELQKWAEANPAAAAAALAKYGTT